MEKVYPVILTPVSDNSFSGYAVHVPDLEIDTQGESLAEAISMARDSIGMWACFELDEGRSVPEPNSVNNTPLPEGSLLTLVDIDIDVYRRAHDNRTIRKNLTLPKWLNDLGENADVNFSQILQNALKEHLGINEPIIPKTKYYNVYSPKGKAVKATTLTAAKPAHKKGILSKDVRK